MAKIESLPDIDWPPEAAIASLEEESSNIEELFIIYRSKEDGKVYSIAAGVTVKDAFWLLEFEKARLIRIVTEGM